MSIDYTTSYARLSDCGVYRYELFRSWDPELPVMGWVMLNPSTADGEEDDPTVRKCVGFAQRLGYGSIRVVNLFAFRATDPKDLARAASHDSVDVVGPDNDRYVRSVMNDPWTRTFVGWGANGARTIERVNAIGRIEGAGWAWCLGTTASGMPKHPLMLPYDLTPEPYYWPDATNPSTHHPVVESNSSVTPSDDRKAGSMTSGIGEALADAKEPVSILLYGKEGSAKTTEALGLARLGSIIAIDAEGGMKPTALRQRGIPLENVQIWPPRGDVSRISFETVENEVYVPIRKALEDARAAGQPDPVVGIVIDSFSELANILTKQAASESAVRDAAKGKQRARFQVNVEDYGTQTQMIRTLLRMFRDLGIHLVITALERRDQDDDGFVQYGPALGPAAATDTAGMVDCVIWCQSEEIGEQSTLFYTGTTRPRERHRAKDRFGKLPVRMIEPSADRVVAYIQGALTKQNDDRHKAAVTAARGPQAEQPAPTGS